MATDKNVTIYSTPTCQYCKKAKSFFDEHEVEYTDYNVQNNPEKRDEMLEKTDQMGVPVIIVSDPENDESEMIVGFEKDALIDLLNLQ
ncbi:MAG: NrdH-redoxin [Parcubacteria group bacterium SW_4_46_8]|nr:MAG: NrdH-redoxin [Parcubacteria group bacterium SW_4_46_8]